MVLYFAIYMTKMDEQEYLLQMEPVDLGSRVLRSLLPGFRQANWEKSSFI